MIVKPHNPILNGLLSCLFNHISDAREMQLYIFSNITFKADIKAPLVQSVNEMHDWKVFLIHPTIFIKKKEFWLFLHKLVCDERGIKDRKIIQPGSLVWWWCIFVIILSLVLLLIQITLMILLEGFLVIPIVSLTKNPSRRIINVIWMSKRTRL